MEYTTPPFVPFDTEELHLMDARQKKHREVLKARLEQSRIELDSIEYAIRVMIMQGLFDETKGVPETMLTSSLPAFVFKSSSPFMTISEIASSIPWLLRVHQTMEWVQTMPNGIKTRQRLICPAARCGKIAGSKGVLGIDWNIIDDIVFRTKKSMRRKRKNAIQIAGADGWLATIDNTTDDGRLLETPPPDSLSVSTAPTTTTTVPLESKLATMALASSIPEKLREEREERAKSVILTTWKNRFERRAKAMGVTFTTDFIATCLSTLASSKKELHILMTRPVDIYLQVTGVYVWSSRCIDVGYPDTTYFVLSDSTHSMIAEYKNNNLPASLIRKFAVIRIQANRHFGLKWSAQLPCLVLHEFTLLENAEKLFSDPSNTHYSTTSILQNATRKWHTWCNGRDATLENGEITPDLKRHFTRPLINTTMIFVKSWLKEYRKSIKNEYCKRRRAAGDAEIRRIKEYEAEQLRHQELEVLKQAFKERSAEKNAREARMREEKERQETIKRLQQEQSRKEQAEKNKQAKKDKKTKKKQWTPPWLQANSSKDSSTPPPDSPPQPVDIYSIDPETSQRPLNGFMAMIPHSVPPEMNMYAPPTASADAVKEQSVFETNAPTQAPAPLPYNATHSATQSECVICMDAKTTHLIAPCGHKCVCAECAMQIDQTNRCPICMRDIVMIVPVFE